MALPSAPLTHPLLSIPGITWNLNQKWFNFPSNIENGELRARRWRYVAGSNKCVLFKFLQTAVKEDSCCCISFQCQVGWRRFKPKSILSLNLVHSRLYSTSPSSPLSRFLHLVQDLNGEMVIDSEAIWNWNDTCLVLGSICSFPARYPARWTSNRQRPVRRKPETVIPSDVDSLKAELQLQWNWIFSKEYCRICAINSK